MTREAVLVTGPTGFVGGYMVRHLLTRGFHTVCFVKKGTSEDVLKGLDVEVQRGDVCDRASVLKALSGVQAVIHLASAVGIPDPQVNYAVNVEGSRNVVEACKARGVKRLIAFSSVSATRKRTSAYGVSKKAAENAVLDSGLYATVLRTEMMYGNGSRGLYKIIRHIQTYPFVIPMVGRGDILRQPVYVKDVVKLTVDIIENSLAFRRLFDIAGKDRVPLRDFVMMIAEELGVRKRILRVPAPMALGIARAAEKLFKIPPFTYDNMLGLTVSTNVDITAAVGELGFAPTPLREGIRRALQEFRENVLTDDRDGAPGDVSDGKPS